MNNESVLFTPNLLIYSAKTSDGNEQSNIETTQENYVYNNNQTTDKHEGSCTTTNHTIENLSSTNKIIENNCNNILDFFNSKNEILIDPSDLLLSDQINNNNNNYKKQQINDDKSQENLDLNQDLFKHTNPRVYSSSINQLYLNRNNSLKEIDDSFNINSNNYDTNIDSNQNDLSEKSLHSSSCYYSNANRNNFSQNINSTTLNSSNTNTNNNNNNNNNFNNTNQKVNPDFVKHIDEQANTINLQEKEANEENILFSQKNKKFNLPNFTFIDNNNLLLHKEKENQTSIKTQLIIESNSNKVASSPSNTNQHLHHNKIKSHKFNLMHQSSLSSTGSSPPPPLPPPHSATSIPLYYPPTQPKTTSVFNTLGYVDTGSFSTTPMGVKGLNRKNDFDMNAEELFSANKNKYSTTTNATTTTTTTTTPASANNNIMNKNNNFNSATMFHPTWDEWKRSHLNEKNNINTSNTNLNESISFRKINSDNYSNKQNSKHELNDNKNTFNASDTIEKNTTTRSFIEETIRHKNISNSNQHQQNYYQNQNQNNSEHNQMHHSFNNQKKTGIMYLSNNPSDVYNPPSPIVINDSSKSQFNNEQQVHSSRREQNLNQSKKSTNTNLKNNNRSPRHYPVYPFDAQPNRANSPVHLSSIVLAKEPPIEVEVKDFKIEPEPIQPEPQQPKKIKTIMSTQKRKESAPNLTGWRTESDSDTEIQNRLLAKASGSIPIEYISIRRDPKPCEKRPEKNKKSITTGTNTSTERGKRIASTNTNQDELPQYNLHVSLDSLFVKSRNEASTSTDRHNRNAATETEVKQRDACTVTDVEDEPEPPPPPPPQPQQYSYKSRKSRYTEWETASTPPEPTYRLEFLTKSPRTVHRRNFQSNQHFHTHEKVGFLNEDDNDLSDICNGFSQVRVDDDDRIIFGSSSASAFNQHHHHHQHYHEQRSCRRSGSFPSLLIRPVPIVVESAPQIRRYIKHTHSTNYTPMFTQQSSQFSTCMPQTNMIDLIPLRTSNGFLNNESWNNQFNQFNSKFSEVFGQQQNFFQQVEPKTERYYKFSRTTTENKHQPVPTFGEIYQRHNSSSSRSHQQFESSNQSNNQIRSPIIEMPATPDSTMGRKRFFSSSSSTAGGYNNVNNLTSSSNKAAYSSGYNSFSQGSGGYTATSTATSTSGIGGPHNTVLSPTPIFVNHDSACSSSTQKTFEPIAKQSHNYASSSSKIVTNSSNNLGYNKSHSSVSLQPNQIKTHGFNKEEEDEEIFSLGGPNQNIIDSDKQFRPIYHPVINETNGFGSTRTTPITVTNMSNNKNKRNNFSTSSYEYSESHGGNQQNSNKWQNGHQQRFNSTQTIAN